MDPPDMAVTCPEDLSQGQVLGPAVLWDPVASPPRTATTREVLGTTCSAGIPVAAATTTTEAIQTTPATTIKILTSRRQYLHLVFYIKSWNV